MSSLNTTTTFAMPIEQRFLILIQTKFTQYAYMFATCAISLIFLVRFWFLSKKQGQSKLSTQLQIHVCVHIAFNFVVILYVAPIIFWWFDDAPTFNVLSLSLRGSANLAIGAVTAISAGLVTLDRIFTLTFPLLSRSKWKYRLQVTSACFLVVVFFVNTNLNLWRNGLEINVWTTTSCSTHGCLVGQNKSFLAFKMCIGWVNLLLGIFFVYSYLRFGRKMIIRREKKKNSVALLLLINEFFLNIIPTSAYIFLHTENTTTIALTSLATPAQCLDSAITTLVLWRTWREKFRLTSHVATVRNVEPKRNTTRTQPIAVSPI